MASHLVRNVCKKSFLLTSSSSQPHNHLNHHLNPHLYNRSISTTPYLNGWVDKIKGVWSGNKSSTEETFTLLKFADSMATARKLGPLKQFVAGKGSETAVLEAFAKQEEVLRFSDGFDPTGENIKLGQKQEEESSELQSEFEWSDVDTDADTDTEEYNFSKAELEKTEEWNRTKPKEYHTGETVYNIKDNFLEKKITLTSKCDDGVRIRIVVTLPQDGHAYYDREQHLHVTLMAKNGSRQTFGIQTFCGLGHFNGYCDEPEQNFYSEHEAPETLKKRGIDMSMEIFLRGYMVEKFVRENLIPNINYGY